jgi:hypothetical protein
VKRFISLILSLAAALLLLPVLSAAANSVSADAVPAEGGIVTGGGSYESGDDVTLTAAPNEGYTFTGWFEGNTLITRDQTYPFIVFSDRAIEARFTENSAEPQDGRGVTNAPSYTVAFNASGGTGAPPAQSKIQGLDLTLTAAQPSRSAAPGRRWVFLGWHDSPIADDAGEQPRFRRGQTNVYTEDADITLYAAWESGTGLIPLPAYLLAILGLFMLILGGTLLRKRKK